MSRKRLARGDVVLARFPFTDLRGSALRPAVVISHGEIGEDLVIMAVSSVVRGGRVSTDLPIPETHPEFALSGLRKAFVLRAHKLATVERTVIARRIGRIGPELQEQADTLLRRALALD